MSIFFVSIFFRCSSCMDASGTCPLQIEASTCRQGLRVRRVPLPLVWYRLRVPTLENEFVGPAEQQDLLFALLQDIFTESVEYLHIGVDLD